MEANEGEVSDAMSDNELDEANLQILREVDNDNDDIDIDIDLDIDHEHDNDHDQDHDNDNDSMTDERTVKTTASVDGSVVAKKKYDPKDPLRPRRKKARRACFACQRAHLTCGMECFHRDFLVS